MSKTKKTAKPAEEVKKPEAAIVETAKPADPRPEYPKLEKVPLVSDMTVARVLKFAAKAAKLLKLDADAKTLEKAAKEKPTKTNERKASDARYMLTMIKTCQPAAEVLERNARAVRGYAVSLACWKKRNGKSMTKEERLLASIYTEDNTPAEPVKEAKKSTKKPAKKGGAK